jgi:hypothetical protein
VLGGTGAACDANGVICGGDSDVTVVAFGGSTHCALAVGASIFKTSLVLGVGVSMTRWPAPQPWDPVSAREGGA